MNQSDDKRPPSSRGIILKVMGVALILAIGLGMIVYGIIQDRKLLVLLGTFGSVLSVFLVLNDKTKDHNDQDLEEDDDLE